MITGSLQYLRRPFVPNVEVGDDVLIVTDTRHDPRVWQAVMSIISDLGAEPTLALFEPRPADYYDPPAAVCAAMLEADVNVLLATTGMLHSPASMAAMSAGIPSICLDGGMQLEHFQSGGVTADYFEISRLKHFVARNVFGTDGKSVRVTSRWGTDVTYSIAGRIFVPPLRPEGWDPMKAYRRTEEGRKESPIYACLYPTGEFNVPPIEGSAEGKVVIDLTMHHLGRLQTPVELTVKEGRITDIAGGAEAWTLRRHLERYGDENATLFPTEASIGINRQARVVGCQREDKNIFGAIHFGLGTNIDVGGTIRSNIHMDGVVFAPTVEVDGQVRIREGEFQVAIDH